MLVDTSLVAVVSLPAGVFNAYSGVKSSILLLDKRVHKQTHKVLFVKVGNDGFNLGAQRRAVVNSDLPEATRLLRSWMVSPEKFEGDGAMAQAVERARIGDSGDFNLSGERYGIGIASQTTNVQGVLGNETIFKIESGGTPSSMEESYGNGDVAWATLADLPATDHITKITSTARTISSQGLVNSSAKMLPVDTVLVSSRATIGRVAIAKIPLATNQGFKNIIIRDAQKALPDFLAYMMKRLTPEMERMASGGTFKEISKSAIATLKIPLPPLEVQHQIVAEIEGYQKIIDGARQVLDNYKPHIVVNPAWPVVQVGDMASIRSGGTPDRSNAEYWSGSIPWVKTGQIDFNVIEEADEFITQAGLESSAARMFPAGTILMAMYGQGVTRGRVAVLGIAATTNQACAAIEVTSADTDRDFLYWSLAGKYEELRAMSESRGGNQRLSFHLWPRVSSQRSGGKPFSPIKCLNFAFLRRRTLGTSEKPR